MNDPLPPWNPDDLGRLRHEQNPEQYPLDDQEPDIQPTVRDDDAPIEIPLEPPAPKEDGGRGVDTIQLL